MSRCHAEGPCRDRRRRQLREQPRPGRRVLPQRRSADDDVPGLMHVELGGYHVGDVEFVAAFDVDAAKVGLDLGKAIFAGQNNTIKFADVAELGVHGAARPDVRRPRQVLPRDGRGVARPSRSTSPRCCATRSADVLVSYLPGRLRGRAALLRAGLPRRRRRRS